MNKEKIFVLAFLPVAFLFWNIINNPIVIKFFDYQNWFWLVTCTAVVSVLIILIGQGLGDYLGEEP